MKYVLKKILTMTLVLSMLLSMGNVVFAEEFENPDDLTMQYLEDELKAHLAENHPDIEFGTVEFIEYLMTVMLEDADEELKSRPNYKQIRYFGGEYLYELDMAQAEMEEPFEQFQTSDEFRAKPLPR